MFGNMKLEYEILPDLKLMDVIHIAPVIKRFYRQAWSSYGGDGGEQTGLKALTAKIGSFREMNADFMISYRKIGKFEICHPRR